MDELRRIDWDSVDLIIDDDSPIEDLTLSPKLMTQLDCRKHLIPQNYDAVFICRFTATLGKIVKKTPCKTTLEFNFYWVEIEFEDQNRTTEIACWMTKELPISPRKISPLTLDLAKQWTIYKDYIFRIALIIAGNSEALSDYSLKDPTDKFSRDLTRTIGNVWKNLLELLQQKWDVIKPFLDINYPNSFQEPEDLFKKIIEDEHTNDFGRFLNGRYCINRRELQSYHNLAKKKQRVSEN